MIIGFSGRKQSGKDTSGSIAQILLNSPHLNNNGVKDFLRKQVNPDGTYYSQWEMKKFADKLKQITALLIGCTREQLEDEEFKSSILGEEWWYYKIYVGNGKYELVDYLNNNKSQDWLSIANPRYLVKTTPRLLLQLIGTECGRDIIHPQVWVNATLADYKSKEVWKGGEESKTVKITSFGNGLKGKTETIHTEASWLVDEYPNWIITDMRFPNELEAIKSKEGITIRINRKLAQAKLAPGEVEHPSETALDNANFDYVIDNDASIDDLIDSIRLILTNEGLLTKN